MYMIACGVLLAAQLAQATVVGAIRDTESGEAVAGALVSLTELGRTVLTDGQGRYAFLLVPAGPQHVSVQRIGYAQRTLHALVPRQGVLEIDIALWREPVVLERLEARSTLRLRGVEAEDSTPFPERMMSSQAVRNHPLLSEPDVFLSFSGGAAVMRAESPDGIHLRGGAADQTAYLLDGVPVFNPFHAAGTFSAWNPDALERVHLLASGAMTQATDALSGVVSATTRSPGSRLGIQGGASTTHARLTLDAPLVIPGAGLLVSVRTGFPGVVSPSSDRSYLKGESGDVLAKLESPLLGGQVRGLGYHSENEFNAASGAAAAGQNEARHVFRWRSQSLGVEWSGRLGSAQLRVQGWNARADAQAGWRPLRAAALTLNSVRDDAGVLARLERRSVTSSMLAGVWLRRSRTTYRAGEESGEPATALALHSSMPVATAFIQQRASLGKGFDVQTDLSASVADEWHLSRALQVRWSRSTALALAGGYARAHQFSQSLRNPESLTGNVFPAELWLGARDTVVPVARSQTGWLAAEYRPLPGMWLAGQAYTRTMSGLLLVAPRTGLAFATDAFATGTGAATGVSLDATLSSARYGVVASYTWQHVRFEHGDSSYVPGHGMEHVADAGVIVFPVPTLSLRAGVSAAAGRRATALSETFEWESCNLLDRGCEFEGSPVYDTGQLAATKLSSYIRFDAGVRKHWHVRLNGRDATLAMFGTLTNLFNQKNVLTVARDAVTGRPVEIDMRPLAPLLIGLDWSF